MALLSLVSLKLYLLWKLKVGQGGGERSNTVWTRSYRMQSTGNLDWLWGEGTQRQAQAY